MTEVEEIKEESKEHGGLDKERLEGRLEDCYKAMDDIKREMFRIDDQLDPLQDDLEEIEAEIGTLEDQRADLFRELEGYIKEEASLKARLEQYSIVCQLKCVNHKNPSECEKTDQSKCVYKNNRSLEGWL